MEMAFFVVEHATRILNSVAMKDKIKKAEGTGQQKPHEDQNEQEKILRTAQNDIKKQRKRDIHVLGSRSA